MVGASYWQVLSLPSSKIAEALDMLKDLEFVKVMSFLNLIKPINKILH
jgi:hypothetical protein